MVGEIKRQLPDDVTPDAIFCSVGGAGLLGGILLGCKDAGWENGQLQYISIRETRTYLIRT